MPDKLQFNVIEISAILGGLLLAAASIGNVGNRVINRNTRKRFLLVSIELIKATVLLLFFTSLTYWAYKDGNPILFSWDFSSSANILRGTSLIISLFCFFVGHPLFLMGIIDLMATFYSLARPLSNRKK
ncbi:MAG: hypothetical protein V1767_01450 [Chloroflexota bacterium]